MSQRAAVAVEYERVESIAADERRRAGLRQNHAEAVPVILPEREKGDARDKAADLFNVSGKSVSDAKYVAEHAPEAFVKHGGTWAYALKVARWVEAGTGGRRTTAPNGGVVKVSQGQFAECAGVSQQTVSRYLKAWDYASEVGLVTHSTRIAPGVDHIIGGIDRSGRLTSFVILSTRVTPNLSLADSSRSCNLLIGQMLSLTPNSCVGNKVVAPVLYC